MNGAFAAWQPRYARYGIATFPVKDKRPSVKGWRNIGLKGSSHLAAKFPDAEAFGFQCGCRSRVTVIDIDSQDVRIVREAIKMFGESPLMWRTGSGNHAMAFRYNGEIRRIRPFPKMPIDILGSGGFALLPPSSGAKSHYEFLVGGIENLSVLPAARLIAGENEWLDSEIPKGRRADTLFNFALDQARHVDDFQSLLDVVLTRNLDCEESLSDREVVKTVVSAWGYEQRGENLKGRGGAVVIPNDVIDTLIDHPDAWRLYGKLRRHHWARNFALANAMGREWHWGWSRFKAAIATLVRHGLIVRIHKGGEGSNDPPIFAWCRGLQPRDQ